MRLEVPMLYQTWKKPYCGPACLRMLLAYYGCPSRLQDIIKALPMTENGVYMAEMAQFLLDRGFQVRLNVWLQDFPKRFAYMDGPQAQAHLKHWAAGYRCTKLWKAKHKTGRSALHRFIRRGGVAAPERTSTDDLGASLAQGVPPILNLNAAEYRPWFGKAWRNELTDRRSAGHYVVLTGMDGKTMTVNDPSRANGGVLTMPTELVMHALYSWSGAVIFAKLA